MEKRIKHKGVSLFWLVLITAAGAIAGYMMMNTAKQNRAWLQKAAILQHQVETLNRLHKENQVLSARLSELEDPSRLLYMANYMHLNRHWMAKGNGHPKQSRGLAGYGIPSLPGNNDGTYAMRNGQ